MPNQLSRLYFIIVMCWLSPQTDLQAQKIQLKASQLLGDHPLVNHHKEALINGVLKENTSFPNDPKAVPTEEAIPGTGIHGQFLVIDLQGEVALSEICVYDTYGEPQLKVYGGPNLFELQLLADFDLRSYLKWNKQPVEASVRFLVLNNPGSNINGIGELELYGKNLQRDQSKPAKAVASKPIKNIWGVNTHDYDHIASSARPELANIADINPLRNERTYAEFHKNVQGKVVDFKRAGPGAVTEQDVNEMRDRRGTLMVSIVGNLPQIENSYPAEIKPKRDLPWVRWEAGLSKNENREKLYQPDSYKEMRDFMMVMARHFKSDKDLLILQWANEYDKIWMTEYHRMNPFMMAALYSTLWDGHEGRNGRGIKDVDPGFKIAWMSQAYHSVEYLRLAQLWFEHFRTDAQFCADIIASNAYCNNRDGIQHTPGSTAIPPEGSKWIAKVKELSEFAHRAGLEFALTEFGADHNGVSVNSVVVNEQERQDAQRIKNMADWQGKKKAYQEEYYPKWREQLLQRQAAWDLRYFLEATPYAEYLFKYHIRDIGVEGSNMGTYSTCGIAFDRREVERGQLELKPNGIALKQFIDSLGDYHFKDRKQEGNQITMRFENEQGAIKRVQWTTDPDSMPRILP